MQAISSPWPALAPPRWPDIRPALTTLFAAFNVLEGGVIGRCMQRHRRQEFIRFLKAHPLRTLSCGPMPKPELNATLKCLQRER